MNLLHPEFLFFCWALCSMFPPLVLYLDIFDPSCTFFFPPIVPFSPLLLFLVEGHTLVAFSFVWLGLIPVPTNNIFLWVLVTTVCKCKLLPLMATILYFQMRNTNKESPCSVEMRFGTSYSLQTDQL